MLLGVYSKYHDGTFDTVAQLFFSTQLSMKTWLALVAGLLAIFQIISAEIMYGRIKVKPFPKWIVPAHRLAGLGAVLFSLPGRLSLPVVDRVRLRRVRACGSWVHAAGRAVLLRARSSPRSW